MLIEQDALAAWKRQAYWARLPRGTVLVLIDELQRLTMWVKQLREENARLEAELEVTSRDLTALALRCPTVART
jgi:hypothetical protein